MIYVTKGRGNEADGPVDRVTADLFDVLPLKEEGSVFLPKLCNYSIPSICITIHFETPPSLLALILNGWPLREEKSSC